MPTKGEDPGHESQQEKRNKGHEMKIHRMGEKEKKKRSKRQTSHRSTRQGWRKFRKPPVEETDRSRERAASPDSKGRKFLQFMSSFVQLAAR
jgi:hypothetical protein